MEAHASSNDSWKFFKFVHLIIGKLVELWAGHNSRLGVAVTNNADQLSNSSSGGFVITTEMQRTKSAG